MPKRTNRHTGPVLVGAVYQATGSYAIGLLLLAATALLDGVFALKAFRRPGAVPA